LRCATSDSQPSAIEKQADAIRSYAEKHRLEIAKTYIDDCKGGLTMEGRDGLQSLLADIQSGAMEYDVVVMRDVMRWGRDAEICRFCEDHCRRHGVEVRYLEGRYENSDSLVAVIYKSVRRVVEEDMRRERAAGNDVAHE